MAVKPVERSLYHPILSYLENLGFKGVQEIKEGEGYRDILMRYDGNEILVEIKIAKEGEGERSLIDGIVQIFEYARKSDYDANNVIVISYPPSVRRKINNLEEVENRSLRLNSEAVIITDYWYSYLNKINVDDIFSSLKGKIEKEVKSAKNIQTAAEVIKKSIKHLSNLVHKQYGYNEKSLRELSRYIGSEELFYEDELESDKLKETESVDIISMILVNQILFYFLYSKRESRRKDNIPQLYEINNLNELSNYFDKIKKVDFRPIYDINVIDRIRSTKEIVEWINNIINTLKSLRVEEFKHDLYGRLIGKNIPDEIRDKLSSYYTKVSSAELLARLTISSWDESVWDLACGSGTLLTSAYNTKLEKYKSKSRTVSQNTLVDLHERFLQEDLTGTDIMKFACHLTGLNLSAQNLNADTEKIRISRVNTFQITDNLPYEADEAFGKIKQDFKGIKPPQREIIDYSTNGKDINKYKEKIKPETFTIDKVDTVLINPPFTKRERIPHKVREFLKKETDLEEKCGNRIAYWGYFLAFADEVIKDSGGKIGAIIPISLLRGNDTQKLRDFLLENYTLEYIIKPKTDTQFSEDSEYSDMILIAKKGEPMRDHEVKMVYLKENITSYGVVNIKPIISKIERTYEKEVETEYFLIRKIKQSELKEGSENLMPFLFSSNLESIKIFENIQDNMKENPNFKRIEKNNLGDGIQSRPAGTADRQFFTRNICENRIKNSRKHFKEEKENYIEFFDEEKSEKFRKDKEKLIKSLRTQTCLDSVVITNSYDFYEPDPDESVSHYSHVHMPRRLRLNSENTHALAFYHKDEIPTYNSFHSYLADLDEYESKFMVLYFNSLLYLFQLLALEKQTTGGFSGFMQKDLKQVYIPQLEKISSEKIENFVNEWLHKFSDLPPLKEQFNKEKSPNFHIEFDKELFEILDLNHDREEILKLYEVVRQEIISK